MAIRVFSILRWIVVAALLFVLAAPAAATYVRGSSYVEVVGMSMSPTYVIGDVLMVTPPASSSDFEVGDVVTAVDENGIYVTHRVSAIREDGSLELRGDANTIPDPDTIWPSAVLGIVDIHFAQPWARLIIQLQEWPMRVFIMLTVFGLAMLPLHKRDKPAPAAASVPVEGTRRSVREARV
ncbi:signal peptidase I [Microbacterium endophyticum]|uniref:Signal peptidase I n=1 Tax=Microbacterium endophyticum TaxID=1526412 RepID=A0A7W4V3Z5_9MICO|nr:signal peptidase I [Microbacterium endophyticum]MBB2976431.1 signal peptidase I [Microbacterium endophyticum]NIK35877.1 signal peptidase I [Microbacterium endophyticum]